MTFNTRHHGDDGHQMGKASCLRRAMEDTQNLTFCICPFKDAFLRVFLMLIA